MFYWLALMFLGGGVAVGLGFQLTNPSFESSSQFDREVGVGCAACHDPGVTKDTADTCEHCHQQDVHYILNPIPINWDHVPPRDLDPTHSTVGCTSCHDSHNATYANQLRAAGNELCGLCHGGSASASSTTLAMFNDVNNRHSNFDCADCHTYELQLSSIGALSTKYTMKEADHAWDSVNLDSCNNHHANGAERIQRMEDIQANVTELMAIFAVQLANVTSKIDEANGTEGADKDKISNASVLIAEAKTLVSFVENDGSDGFHNPTLAEGKLKLALFKLEEAYAQAEDAIAPAPPTDTTETSSPVNLVAVVITIVTMAIGIIASVAILYRKK